MTPPAKLPSQPKGTLLHVRWTVGGYEARCWKVPPGLKPGQLLAVPVADRELLWAGVYDEDRHLVRSLAE